MPLGRGKIVATLVAGAVVLIAALRHVASPVTAGGVRDALTSAASSSVLALLLIVYRLSKRGIGFRGFIGRAQRSSQWLPRLCWMSPC